MLALVLPIVAQNLITALVNMADVVLLGSIGQSAISAVSLAGQITFIVMLFTFGVGTGVGILTAQYWGKKDLTAIESIIGIGVGLLFIVSFAFFAVSVAIPKALMSLLTNDGELVTLGAQYLRIMSATYLLMSVSQVYINAVRSMEHTRLTAIISSVSLLFNVAFDAIVVFILFPGDIVMAVRGVAVATVLARIIELITCLALSSRGSVVRLRIKRILHFDRPLFSDFFKYAAPAQVNYLVWGGGLTATVAIMGHVGSDMVAANSVASVVRNLVMVLCTGIGQGGSILVGKSLGAGDIAKAKSDGFAVVKSALIFGILAGLILLTVRPLTVLFDLTKNSKFILNGMLYISAVYCVGKSLNSTVIGGLFCAGGDAKFGLICDAITMWCVVIPLGLLFGFYLKVPPLILYAVLCMDEIVKMPFMVLHYRKYKWLKNITRENAEKEVSL
ncbi:MAG: MATE family efflux transporter [Prevotellaceae bacterium]|jgi:putative MATE family efflux protein|nr:MATE family efflux transporter [Prevotellaceae bacterium]